MNQHQKHSIAYWLEQTLANPDKIAFKYKKNNEWISKSNFEYLTLICHFQNTLKNKKIKPGQKVALMSNTRWEWATFDIAVLAMKSILVPIYPNLTDEDVLFILNHSESDILIVDNDKLKNQFLRIFPKLNKKIECLLIEDLNLDQFEQTNSEDLINHESHIKKMIQKADELLPEDPITIIYTSGTTGQPKGVLLQHRALISEVFEAFSLFNINQSDISLAFLPYAHVMGRIEHWGCFFKQTPVAYAESIDTLRKDLIDIKPTFLIAVPRIFEKIYSSISAKVETSPLKKRIFTETIELAKKMQYYRETHQAAPFLQALLFESLSQLVFTPVKAAFGGRLRFAISGGAPLSRELGLFFSHSGIKLLEGYGLTETFAAITVNTESSWQLGTVGKPIGDVEIKFAEDGEILVRSHKCLKEYYKNPQATSESIDSEGFFATGDIGEFTENGYLKITDRKKDLIKTAGGKYVAPQKLEGLLKLEPLISQVLICGDQKKFISALITVESLAVGSSSEEKQSLLIRIKKHVQGINSQLSSFEAIKKFEVIFETWTVENGCLTPSMKVKRKFILERYSHIIKSFYGENDSSL